MDYSLWQYVPLFIVLYLLLDTLRVAFKPGLRKIPGPLIARFSKLWRMNFVRDGQAPFKYQRLHQKYGPIVRSGPNTVEISDPAVIPIVYGIQSKFVKTLFYSTMTPPYRGTLMPSMFSTQDPAYHKALKQPVASKFSMTSIKSFEPYVDQCTDIFIAEMRKRAGEAVDLSEWCQYYAFDVIGAITFQYRFGFMEQGNDVDGMMAAIWMGLTYAGIVGQMPELHPYLLGNAPLVKLLASMRLMPDNPFDKLVKITENRIETYEKEDDRGDFMSWLRDMQEKNPERMTNRDLVNHLSNNLLAGSDTTAISLRAIFYFLVKNPRCYKIQMGEIEQFDKAGLLSKHVSYEECLQMPYLQVVMKEALRMHPGIGFPLERYVPAGGANLCGVDLAPGTIVGVNPHVIMRDTEVYGKDANEFRPERWMEATAERLKIMERSFIAFGGGVRTCVGKNISILEMGKMVSQVLRHFELEWATEREEWKTECYWMHKQRGLIVRFRAKA